MFNPNEIIDCEAYRRMCDYNYEGQDELPSGVISVDVQAIPEFFAKIDGNGKKYVVVSSHSDYGICLQKNSPPWKDIEKWCGMCAESSIGYDNFTINARLDHSKCNKDDKYSIKCWSYTSGTFDKIPDNVVHIFATNCSIVENKITNIPFGISGITTLRESLDKISKLNINKPRTKTLYVNFQYCTIDRYRLFGFYRGDANVTCFERGRNINEYYEDLASHKFILCPEGNGIDCYRNLEAMYCGAIPIMPINQGLLFYIKNKQRVLLAKSLYNLNIDFLDSFYESMISTEINKDILDTNFLKLSYWKNLVENKRSLL